VIACFRARQDLTRPNGLTTTTRTEPSYVAVKMSNQQEMHSHAPKSLMPNEAFNEKNIITITVMRK
jgi:hypothetical protein